MSTWGALNSLGDPRLTTALLGGSQAEARTVARAMFFGAAGVAGTAALTLDALTLTATGAVGPFRYVVLYNDTPTSPADPLIQFWDYGSDITLADGETFLLDVSATNGILQATL